MFLLASIKTLISIYVYVNKIFFPNFYVIHIHLFNGPFSGTTWVSWYQKGKTNLDFSEARDSEWQWHQLGHMQVCTSLQTDNHHSVFTVGCYASAVLAVGLCTSVSICHKSVFH